MALDTVIPSIEHCIPCFNNEVHGECVKYKDKYYYYRDGKKIPKNKVACLIYEVKHFVKIKNDVEYIYVAWNGESFTVLSHEYSYSHKYNKMLPADAILLRERELKKSESKM